MKTQVHLALTMAIDRADMIKTLDNGLIGPMDSVFRHDSPFYDASITQLGYDPVKAQSLFNQLAAAFASAPAAAIASK